MGKMAIGSARRAVTCATRTNSARHSTLTFDAALPAVACSGASNLSVSQVQRSAISRLSRSPFVDDADYY